MFLVVGLGNPGEEYRDTRHNAGFMVAERFISRHGLPRPRGRYQGRWCEGSFAGRPVAVLMPQTFMNNSGASVREAAMRKHISLEDIIVIHDDLDFPFGVVRVRAGGGSGGHKGLESIAAALGTTDFNRVRVGIGRPDEIDADASEWVLSDLEAPEADLEAVLDLAGDCVDTFIRFGIERAMNRFNRKDEEES